MKKMKYLGCLLALVFAGASAFAGVWFVDSVGQDLPITRWYTTTKGTSVSSDEWVWTTGAQGELSYGSYNNWTTPLTYEAEQSQSLAAKDSTITTSVKFTAMDIEDLNDQNKQGIGSDVKGGLTVVEDLTANPTLSYYGIVDVNGTKEWKPLTGATPTLGDFVTVTVELKNNLNNTYTITYKVGDATLTVADASFTMVTATEATISKVEYLGQFSLKSLAGATWFNPCTVESPIIAGIKEGSVKAYDANIEPLKEYALNKIPRGATVEFAFEAADNYFVSVKDATYTTTGETATEAVTWGNYVVATEMPTPPEGKEVPSKYTIDNVKLAGRVDTTDAQAVQNYLFKDVQANGQLGWVNVTLGLNDDASGTIAATNATPVEGAVAISFGVDVPAGVTVTYNVGSNEGLTTPNIGLSETKSENIGIVDVEMVLKDEGGEDHVISTAKVGVMETGKAVPTIEDEEEAAKFTTFDIVAVPWASFGGDAISVKDLLNTAMLTAGDTLYIWNGSLSLYDTYTLNASGAWVAGSQTSRSSAGATKSTSPAPEEKKIAKGTAIWIERNVAAGGETEATWSLIANPSIKAFDLSSIPVKEGDENEGAVAGDKLIVEDAADPREYEFNGTSWGYNKTVRTQVKRGSKWVWVTSQTWDAEHNVIPAGIGFWYVRSPMAGAFKITFEANSEQN